MLSQAPGLGFTGLDFSTLSAAYDPARGLVFDVTAALYDGDAGESFSVGLTFTLNQSTGDITAAYR